MCRSFNKVVVGLAKCVSKTRLAQQRHSATNSPTLFPCRCELLSLSATRNSFPLNIFNYFWKSSSGEHASVLLACRVRSSLLAQRAAHQIQWEVLVARAVRVLMCWCASSRLRSIVAAPLHVLGREWTVAAGARVLSADYVFSATLPSAVPCRHHNGHLRELRREVVTEERKVVRAVVRAEAILVASRSLSLH